MQLFPWSAVRCYLGSWWLTLPTFEPDSGNGVEPAPLNSIAIRGNDFAKLAPMPPSPPAPTWLNRYSIKPCGRHVGAMWEPCGSHVGATLRGSVIGEGMAEGTSGGLWLGLMRCPGSPCYKSGWPSRGAALSAHKEKRKTGLAKQQVSV